jgi:hypothetical protein
VRWLTAFALLVTLVTVVGSATAQVDVDLVNPDVRILDNFYPCPGFTPAEQQSEQRGPYVDECLDANNNWVRLQPNVVDVGQTSCAPGGTSTIRIQQRTAPSAVNVPGGGLLTGAEVTWDLTATIDVQEEDPVGEYQPFQDDGMRMGSVGFETGLLASLQGTMTINPSGTGPDIVAQVALASNAGNWGVCRTFFQEATGNPNVGGGVAPVTGDFYIVNAGVLTYDVTSGPEEFIGEEGMAELYLSNSFVTCCGAENPQTGVNAATGHFRLQFGTTHPSEGSSGQALADAGTEVEEVTLSNFTGLDESLGGVSLTFPDVSASGEVTVTHLLEVPDLGGFQVGDPPAFYEISTSAELQFTPPVEVCLPYGSLPEGVTPQIKHYVDGVWENVPITFDSGLPDQIVCGEVDSFSPVAVVYTFIYDVAGPFQPVDPYPTVNAMKAGRSVPLKFSLGGDYGLDVFADEYPQAVGGECSASVDPVETTTTNASGLVYDATSGVYTYNWKTSSNWKGQCRTFILQFSDGQELKANFKFN